MDQSKIEAFRTSLNTIEARAEAVKAGKVPETYTEKLIASQNDRVKKLTSEAGELVREDWRPDFSAGCMVGEAADVNYSVSVMTAARGLPMLAPGRQRTKLYARTEDQVIDRILSDRTERTQLLGIATMGLVACECQPVFDASAFIDTAARVLLMTDFILAGQGLTSEPVIDELIRRNQL
jgi:phosphoribosyl-ATP pyrophosphohydrolase